MGLLDGKNKAGHYNMAMLHTSGIPDWPQGTNVIITADTDARAVLIQKQLSKDEPKRLSAEKITAVMLTTETEIKEKSKSVGGRAVIGGVLLGPVGAIVGGMSGLGKKEIKKDRTMLIINYTSGGEDKALAFHVIGAAPNHPVAMNLVSAIKGMSTVASSNEL